MRKQCELLGVARSSMAYKAVAEDPEDIRIKRLLEAAQIFFCKSV